MRKTILGTDGYPSATQIGNGHSRPLVSWYELPEDVRVEFDYVRESALTETEYRITSRTLDALHTPRFFKYHDSWYDVLDCEYTLNSHSPLYDWHGFFGHSYWEAVAFRYVDNENNLVEVATLIFESA